MNKDIVVATIGAIALILSTLITGFFITAPTRVSIEATQTAEIKLTNAASTQVVPVPSATQLTAVKTTVTSPLTLTPTEQFNAQPTSSNIFPSIPFRANGLLLSFTGILIIIGFVFAVSYIPKRPYMESTPTTVRILVAMIMISPFVLVWARFFFAFPVSLSLALTLLIALSFFALGLWFFRLLINNPIWSALLLISPIYITAFGFTEWDLAEAFTNATVIIIVEAVYFGLMIVVGTIEMRLRGR